MYVCACSGAGGTEKGLESVHVHMYVSCASEVCTISLAGCVCNFIIKAHAVFICFSLELALLSLISLSSLSLSLSSLLNYLRAFEAEVCVFWGIYRVLRVINRRGFLRRVLEHADMLFCSRCPQYIVANAGLTICQQLAGRTSDTRRSRSVCQQKSIDSFLDALTRLSKLLHFRFEKSDVTLS